MSTRNLQRALVLLGLLASSMNAFSQPKQNPEEVRTEMDVREVIGAHAARTGEKFYLDSRIKGTIHFFNQSLADLSLEDLRTLLLQSKIAIIRSGDYYLVIPEVEAKSQATRLVKEGEKYSNYEHVRILIQLDNSCPNDLVPALRPLLSPTDHFVPLMKTRSLLVATSYGKAIKLKELAKEIDHLYEKKSDCSA